MYSYFRYMNPTADLVQSPTTIIVMNSSTNNSHLSFPANMSSPNHSSVGVFPQTSPVPNSDSHGFGIYQLTIVGASDTTIRTRRFVHHSIVLNHAVSYSIAPSGTIVSNSIAPSGILSNRIVSHSIAPNGTIVSNSIAPNDLISNHIVSYSISFPIYSFSF